MGEGGGAITNEVLKFRKVVEFESVSIVICFSYIYQIIDEKDHLSIEKVIKNLQSQSNIKTLSTCANNSSCPVAAHLYRGTL